MQLAASMARLGTESAFEVLARAVELQASGRDIINLGIGQPDFATPPHIVEAAIEALRAGHHGYTPANGILPLREAVSEDLLNRRGMVVHPDQVVIVPGGKVTMFMAIAMFGEPGAEIMYPDPGFPIYRSLIEWSGAKAKPIGLHESKGFAFSADEVLAGINDRTRLIIVNSPANPTGGIVPKCELDRLVQGLERFPDVAILSDEIYARLCYDGCQHASLSAYPEIADRLILLDGWSKTYAMTGWRLGYGVWPRHLAPLATRLAVNTHSCVNAATQWAGLAALKGSQSDVARMTQIFAARRKLIIEGLNRIPGFRCVTPGGAFYAFPNIEGTGRSARVLQDELLETCGVATVAGTSFGQFGEGYLRFSYAAASEAIETALARIAAYLAG
ncbi:Aspartate/methionine/tyrosine aminotransferase [Arboricoccus pini]|uniref:aspartate transaminase n=1 Tax=Arboricoccus pini TaxID=1963835 RepID=A0A212QMY7_9PROT|nr:pyridoxal phosphate-dependent aminotransferase [Arboricoccus pini]SNB60724.1 Aspartate/methionine/tyrosine aminotransferase [Arboricoccus pini]